MLKSGNKKVMIGYFKHGKMTGWGKDIGEIPGGTGFEYVG
jgi:hypothetical protein